MTLFVVVARNARTGHEYMEMPQEHMSGYAEWAHANAHKELLDRNNEGDTVWEFYVGRIEKVTE